MAAGAGGGGNDAPPAPCPCAKGSKGQRDCARGQEGGGPSLKNSSQEAARTARNGLPLLGALCEGKGLNDYVFTRGDGSPVKDFRAAWQNMCIRAAVPCPDKTPSRFECKKCGALMDAGMATNQVKAKDLDMPVRETVLTTPAVFRVPIDDLRRTLHRIFEGGVDRLEDKLYRFPNNENSGWPSLTCIGLQPAEVYSGGPWVRGYGIGKRDVGNGCEGQNSAIKRENRTLSARFLRAWKACWVR